MLDLVKRILHILKRDGVKLSVQSALLLLRMMITAPKAMRGLPQGLHIETTATCNLSCEYCVLKSSHISKKIMAYADFMRLEPYFKYMYWISLSTIAEPLLHKHISKFIVAIKRANPLCRVLMLSNATLLTGELSKKLINAGLDILQFSLDTADTELSNEIRKGSTLTSIIDNIQELNDVKRKMRSTTPHLYATTVLQTKNYRHLPQTIESAAALGVRMINVNGLEPYSDELAERVLWIPQNMPDDLSDILAQSVNIANRLGIITNLSDFSPSQPCCSIVNTPVILPNGDVTACSVLAYDRDSLYQVNSQQQIMKSRGKNTAKYFGNVFEKDFKEIWFSPEYSSFRKKVLSGQFPGECRRCLLKTQMICANPNISPETVIADLRKQRQPVLETRH